jgi:hypothetical protein
VADNFEFRVWWIPQVPMTPFYYGVPSLNAGLMLCDALARYDLFQLEHNVKPDFANVGGIEYRHPVETGGRWNALDPDDEDEVGFVRAMSGASL